MLYFEKKNQKTFAHLRSWPFFYSLFLCAVRLNIIFWLLFFKNKALPCATQHNATLYPHKNF